jgi:hypothetical protein
MNSEDTRKLRKDAVELLKNYEKQDKDQLHRIYKIFESKKNSAFFCGFDQLDEDED